MDYLAYLEKKESEGFLEYRVHLAFLVFQVKDTVLALCRDINTNLCVYFIILVRGWEWQWKTQYFLIVWFFPVCSISFSPDSSLVCSIKPIYIGPFYPKNIISNSLLIIQKMICCNTWINTLFMLLRNEMLMPLFATVPVLKNSKKQYLLRIIETSDYKSPWWFCCAVTS